MFTSNEVVDLQACDNEDLVDGACVQLQLGDGDEEPATKTSEPIATSSARHRCYLAACGSSHRGTSLTQDYIIGLGPRAMGTGG